MSTPATKSGAILALDVGSKRIGFALAPPGLDLAMPLAPLLRSNQSADFAAIASLIEEHAVTTLVIGDPITLSGARGIAAEQIDRFVEKLRQSLGDHWNGDILRIDERLTTAQATRTLIADDVSRARRRDRVDGMAAALLLETHLRRRRNAASLTAD